MPPSDRPPRRENVYRAIDTERARQADKWGHTHRWGHGDCSSPDVPTPVKTNVLMEEVGEAVQALLDGDMGAFRYEMTQVAAVAVATLEWLETTP